MPVPSEQRCMQCGQMFMGSDVHGYPCPVCQGLTSTPVIDYSQIEKRIMGWNMDTTILDLYGTKDNAWSALKKALRAEKAWSDLTGQEKLEFQNWIAQTAAFYKDGEGIDWIGAFYDWQEER